jgi:hypothetical protein
MFSRTMSNGLAELGSRMEGGGWRRRRRSRRSVGKQGSESSRASEARVASDSSNGRQWEPGAISDAKFGGSCRAAPNGRLPNREKGGRPGVGLLEPRSGLKGGGDHGRWNNC